MMVSEDDGSTWSYGGKLFTRPKVGYVNGYTQYWAVSHHRLFYVCQVAFIAIAAALSVR